MSKISTTDLIPNSHTTIEVEDEKLGTIKTMKYANTVGLLIEAVKDLSKQVEELKNGSTN